MSTTNTIMHNQWRSRPNDERFATLADMFAVLNADVAGSAEATMSTDALEIVPVNSGRDGLALTRRGAGNSGAMLTHWATQQLCTIAHAPSTYLRTLPTEYAARDLNWSLQQQPRDSHKLYIARGTGDMTDPAGRIVRAITSPGYARIVTAKIVHKLMDLQEQYPGWKAPEVYPNGDFGGTKESCVGFAGDRDAYICLTDDSHRIDAPGEPGGLARGIIVVNSEVGAKKLDVILFLCERICGNFIIWGFKQIQQISLRHYGDKIRRDWSYGIANVFGDYSNSSAREEQEKINAAGVKQLAGTKDDVIDLVFAKFAIGKKQATDAYELAERYDQNPRSAWGMVHGLTRLSQLTPYADDRIDLDRAAAKILDF